MRLREYKLNNHYLIGKEMFGKRCVFEFRELLQIKF